MKQPVQRRLAAILAADVAGYSRLMGDKLSERYTFQGRGRTGLVSVWVGLAEADVWRETRRQFGQTGPVVR